MLAAVVWWRCGSVHWRHFGRLAGFTNLKPDRRLESGLQPFARLVETSGQVYSRVAAFITEVRAAIAVAVVSETVGVGAGSGRALPSRCLGRRRSSIGIRATRATCIAPTWLGRGTPPRWAFRRRAPRGDHAGGGISKKGKMKRQREYAERTADKAIRQAE